MLEHARVKGGNAVVGMRLDSAALGDGRVELCAYGTAVVAAPVDDGARQTATSLGLRPARRGRGPEETTPPQPTEQPQYAQQQYQQQGYRRSSRQQYHAASSRYPQQYPPAGLSAAAYQQPQQYPQGYPGPQ